MKKWLLVWIGAAVLLAGWRPAPKEPEGLGLVRVLGVDGDRPVKLSAVCGGEDQGDQSRGECTAEEFARALECLPWSGEEELSVTSVSYIIVGRDVDLEEVLLGALRDPELGAAATVWQAEEGAAALLEGCEDPASALALLERQGVEAPTVVQGLAALYGGGSLSLPLLEGKGPRVIDWEEWRKSA